MENNTNTEPTTDNSLPLNVELTMPTEPVVLPSPAVVQPTLKNNQRAIWVLMIMIVLPAIIFGLFMAYSNNYSVAIKKAADAQKDLDKPAFQESTVLPVTDEPTNSNNNTTKPNTTETNSSGETLVTEKPVAPDSSIINTMTNITSGVNFSCGIGPDSLAYCWGDGPYGELGNYNLDLRNSSTPVAVYTGGVLKGKTIKSISAGDHHTCAIASDDQAYCWGIGTYGELGNSYQQVNNYPTAVFTYGALAGKTVKTIKSTARYTCVVASDNLTYCWGLGIFGNDEHDNLKSQLSPALHAAL